MRFRKVICLGGLIALTGCCHTVPTNEFVDPRFNLTLLPYSRRAWMTTLRPTEIKQSNDKGTVLTKKCVLLENKIGFVQNNWYMKFKIKMNLILIINFIPTHLFG